MPITIDLQSIAADFAKAAQLAHLRISLTDIDIDVMPKPHRPPRALPSGKLAVYSFLFGDRCLKVGRTGTKSGARYCSQHYAVGRAPSTLAKSLVKRQATLGIKGLTNQNVEKWICDNTDRINFLISSAFGTEAICLLEAFIQCRLRPEFEGRTSHFP